MTPGSPGSPGPWGTVKAALSRGGAEHVAGSGVQKWGDTTCLLKHRTPITKLLSARVEGMW